MTADVPAPVTRVGLDEAAVAGLPMLLAVPSEDAMYALLSALNVSGMHPEFACVDTHGSSFLAGLTEPDADHVHITNTEGDSGTVHCCECAHPGERGNEWDPNIWDPTYPVTVVVTEWPDFARAAEDEFDRDAAEEGWADWWALIAALAAVPRPATQPEGNRPACETCDDYGVLDGLEPCPDCATVRTVHLTPSQPAHGEAVTEAAIREAIIAARDAHDWPTETDDGRVMRCRCGLWPPLSVLDTEALWLWSHTHDETAKAVHALAAQPAHGDNEAALRALADVVNRAADALDKWNGEGGSLDGSLVIDAIARNLRGARLMALGMLAALSASAEPEEWPCGNYLRPVTCLTAPSSVTGRCSHCRDLASAEPESGEGRG